ncbi:hypothetical protein KVQ82_16410 [Pseudomonas sp. AO-1]|uniref:hypothetical protein n=1 Tax=Pseudomonas sp. AO-1 TaxID=2855434 RepID=UPI001C783449|nr:hypothetical protein [Pseudomonas sp. AO-1]QXZ11676.1 hypothetical protein KVQ82_16410 [Pseudomonas sp. AO-1]
MNNLERRPEGGRNQGDRIGALEQDMKVVRHRLDTWDRRHENSPERLTKLEQQFEHQSDKLDDLETGIENINKAIGRMGTKITYGLGAAAAIMVMFDKIWPIISKGLGS